MIRSSDIPLIIAALVVLVLNTRKRIFDKLVKEKQDLTSISNNDLIQNIFGKSKRACI